MEDIEKLYIWSLLIIFVNIFLLKLSKIKKFKFIFPDNNWAVVTGGTSGIGLAFVEKLLNSGYKILILSKDIRKLEEIKKKHPDSVEVLAVDFSNANIYTKICTFLKPYKISLLINNVGMLGNADYLVNVNDSDILKIINCNIVSCVEMTKIVIANMLEHNTKGTVLNISSITSKLKFPFFSTYSSTKAFIDRFSENINLECKSMDIRIKTINPYFVSTKMTKMKPSFFTPSAEKYVDSIVEYGYFFPHCITNTLLLCLRFFLPCVLYTFLFDHLKSLIEP